MNCEQMELLIHNYMDEELSTELNQLVEDHIKNCETCRRYLEETRAVVEKLETLSGSISTNRENKIYLKEHLMEELRLRRNSSPFLSALHRKKEEIKRRILGEYDKNNQTLLK